MKQFSNIALFMAVLSHILNHSTISSQTAADPPMDDTAPTANPMEIFKQISPKVSITNEPTSVAKYFNQKSADLPIDNTNPTKPIKQISPKVSTTYELTSVAKYFNQKIETILKTHNIKSSFNDNNDIELNSFINKLKNVQIVGEASPIQKTQIEAMENALGEFQQYKQQREIFESKLKDATLELNKIIENLNIKRPLKLQAYKQLNVLQMARHGFFRQMEQALKDYEYFKGNLRQMKKMEDCEGEGVEDDEDDEEEEGEGIIAYIWHLLDF